MAIRDPKTGLFPVEEIDTRGLDLLPLEPAKSPKKVSIATAGPIELGANLFSRKTYTEAIPKGLTAGTVSPLRGILDYFTDVLPRTKPEQLNLMGAAASATGLKPLEGESPDPLAGIKTFLQGIEEANAYTQENYKDENLPSLFGKFSKSGTVEDLQRFTDYTANQVAQQIPQQLALWGSAAAGVPAPIALSLMGMSQAGSKFSEDKENSPNLTEDQRVNRANISGVSSGLTEGLGYGLSKVALAGKTIFDTIPREAMPAITKTLGKGISRLFSDLATTVGADPAKRIMFNTLVDTFGEGAEEVVDTAVNIASDEHYGVKMYSTQEKLNAMIEAFGISAISSGVIGAPMQAANELLNRRESGDLPTSEELFTASHIIKVFKNGLPGSTNPDNQMHVTNGDVILLETLVDDMIQKQEWDDSGLEGAIRSFGEHIKKAAFDERGFVRMPGGNSYLEEVVNSKIPNRASADQILKTLEGAGVPLEEVQDMGLIEWLKGRDKVTKQELIDYLSGNEIEIQEVQKGEGRGHQAFEKLPEEMQRAVERYQNGADGDEIEDMASRLGYEIDFDSLGEIRSIQKPGKESKFHSYTLPGGQNYREVLLTLPGKKSGEKLTSEEDRELRGLEAKNHHYRLGRNNEALTEIQIQRMNDLNRKLDASEETGFKTSHWEEPNVLAHVRLDDRTDSNGKKTLFIEEIQSDWHQKGRREGYKENFTDEEVIKKLESEGIYLSKARGDFWDFTDREGTVKKGGFTSREGAINDARDWVNSVRNEGVPDAPFKKSWHELALKRVLRMAAEEGYDAVAWTTGEQQAERYDLSKQVNKIAWKPESGMIQAVDRSGRVVNLPDTDANELPNVIGKEAARKLQEQEEDVEGWKYLEGENLKVGGEGMKGFYDQIIPSFLNKYTKKWGGRVGNTEINGKKVRTFETPDEIKEILRNNDNLGFDTVGQAARAVFTHDDFQDRWELSPDDVVDIQSWKKHMQSETVHSLEITPAMRKVIIKSQPIYGSKVTTDFNTIAEADAYIKDLQKSFDFMYNSLGTEGEKAYGSKESHDKALNALLDRLRGDSSRIQGGKILKQIFEHLKKNAFAPSVGLTVESIKDVADVVSAYRNPSVEIFQVVFADESGKILGHHAISSNIPNLGVVPGSFMRESIVDKAKALKAAKVYLAHNHPSGRHAVSGEDIAITKKIRTALEYALPNSNIFGGHIVMNGENFSVIDGKGEVSEHTYNSSKPSFFMPDVREILGPKDIAKEISKNFKSGKISVLYLNQSQRVMALEFHKEDANLKETISQKMRAYGAPKYAVVMNLPSEDLYVSEKFKGMTRSGFPEGALDFVVVTPSGDYASLRELTGRITTGANPFLKKELKGFSTNQLLSRSESDLEKSVFKIAEEPKFYNEPDEVKKGYNRNEITSAIAEIQKDLRDIIEDEKETLKSIGENIRGGEIIRPEGQQGGYRTSLPEYLKHPKTGNKPINEKQWRELAIKNLENGKSSNNNNEEYASLKEQKKHFIERLADMEMEAAQVQLNERERAKPKDVEEMSKEERSWFDLQAKQIEAFDEVPPSDYGKIEGELADVDPSELKDISGVEMHLKDFYRNFEKVFGKYFSKVEKSLLKPLDESVNEFVEFQKRFTNELKEKIVDGLGIKKKSKMSAAVQDFGEGKVTEQQLLAEFGPEKTEKIKKAEKWFRGQYDKILDRVNSVRAQIYPGNPDKLVPNRSNYFRHFHEMTELSGLKNIFDSPANIPSELAGTSQYTQPKSKWASFMQRRLGIMTDIDAVGGFLNYLPSAAQAIYVDPMIPKIRALEKKLRVLTHDTRNLNNFIEFLMQYANDLAGKTNLWDRAVQQIVGRKKMKVLDWLTRRVKRNTVLFNVSSMIAQLFNLPQAVGKTKLHFATGSADYLKSLFVKGGPHAKSLFLNTRYGSDVYDIFNTEIVNQPMKLAKWMMQVFDEAATKMTWYSFYDMAVANKIEDPIRYADVNTRKMVAGRGLHEVPLGQKSRMFQALQPFMLEVQNLWWVLGDQVKDKDFVGLVLFAAASWLMNSGAEIIKGSRVSFDPINMLVDALKGNKTIPQRVGRILGEISSNVPFGRQIQELYPEYGFVAFNGYKMPTRSQFFGENNTTRFGNKILAMQAVTEPQYFLLPPAGGGQIKKAIQGAAALSKGYVKSGNKKIRFNQPATTQIKAVTFGKSSIPEVQKYYDGQNDKRAKTKKSS